MPFSEALCSMFTFLRVMGVVRLPRFNKGDSVLYQQRGPAKLHNPFSLFP